jgi:hypothetical protein
MEAITWVPGTDPEFDQLFEVLRLQRYNDQSHRLWKNYGQDAFKSATALTICFNNEHQPEICSSIINRECWPNHVYRIMNRTWKQTNKQTMMKGISPAMAATTASQVQWLKDNTDYQMYFISRETDSWVDWTIDKFKNQYNLEFKTSPYKYLTCPNECDDTCWQKIIYNGNTDILTLWKRRP